MAICQFLLGVFEFSISLLKWVSVSSTWKGLVVICLRNLQCCFWSQILLRFRVQKTCLNRLCPVFFTNCILHRVWSSSDQILCRMFLRALAQLELVWFLNGIYANNSLNCMALTKLKFCFRYYTMWSNALEFVHRLPLLIASWSIPNNDRNWKVLVLHILCRESSMNTSIGVL
jgi:hypothetical protein